MLAQVRLLLYGVTLTELALAVERGYHTTYLRRIIRNRLRQALAILPANAQRHRRPAAQVFPPRFT